MSAHRIPLEVIQIPMPCPADWNAMVGDDRVRFCDGCKKSVHFLSSMTRDEAERLVCESAGNLCVRMAKLADGTVLTVDYQAGSDRPRRRGWRFWTGVGLVGALLAGFAEATGVLPWRTGSPLGSTCVAGGIPAMHWPPATAPSTQPGMNVVAGTMPAPWPRSQASAGLSATQPTP